MKAKSLVNRYLKFSYRAAAISFLVPLTACSFLPKEEPALAPPLVEPAKIEYEVAGVQKGEIVQRVKGTGSLVPVQHHNLSYPQTGGRLKKIHVAEGDMVKKGQILAEIETGNLAYDIDQAEIDLQKAELQLKQLQNQNADRYAIDIAKLDTKSITIRLNQLKSQMEASKIVSPMNGIVTFVGEQKAGDTIEAYQSIVQIADTTNLQLLYTATSADKISAVKVGMRAVVTLNGKTLTGKVVQTPNEIPADVAEKDPSLYKMSIFVSVENLPAATKVGDMADVEIITAQKGNTLIIPKNGLRTVMGRDYVQVLSENTKREVDIEKGIVTPTEVEVLRGLNEGDQVILK